MTKRKTPENNQEMRKSPENNQEMEAEGGMYIYDSFVNI